MTIHFQEFTSVEVVQSFQLVHGSVGIEQRWLQRNQGIGSEGYFANHSNGSANRCANDPTIAKAVVLLAKAI